MNSIFHGRSYGNIAAATQTHIVVTTNTMLVITCHSQCTRTAKISCPSLKSILFIFARYGGVRRSICQIVLRFRLHFYKTRLPDWILIAAPLSLVSEIPARVSLNFLSLYTLKEPLDAEPLSTYSTPATDAFTVTCAPFVVTVTPLTEPVTVAEPLAYAICMEEANDEFL